jgi:Icc-related predicted phosphoesterase
MTFKIQYVSDIHLEMRDPSMISSIPVIDDVKNLALCGDIGYPGDERYTRFIDDCASRFKNVFVLYGNHEYYSTKVMVESMTDKKEYAKFFPKNVYFMDNRSLFANKYTNDVYSALPYNVNPKDYVKIIGTTLWSNIDFETSTKLNDYKYIYIDKYRNITWDRVAEMFITNVRYVANELDNSRNIECLLLTHHSPHPVSAKDGKASVLERGYTTFIPDFYLRKNLVACIHGHTHRSINEKIMFDGHAIKILSNQVGYPMESIENVKYKYDALLEI